MTEKIFNCEEVTLERFLSLRLLKRSREILILRRSEDHVINRVVGHAPNNRSIRVIILDSSARSKCTLVLTRQYMRSSIPLSVRTRANVAWDTHLCWYINVNLLFFIRFEFGRQISTLTFWGGVAWGLAMYSFNRRINSLGEGAAFDKSWARCCIPEPDADGIDRGKLYVVNFWN